MSRTVTAISGELLFRQVRTTKSELGYLIIKHGLTVVEPLIERAKKPFGKPKYVMTDPEELLEIIQYDPGALRNMLFLLSEIDKVCPPGIEVEYDNAKTFCIGQIPFPVSPAEPQRAYLGGKSSHFSMEPVAKRGEFGAAEVYTYDTKASLKDTIEYHETRIKQSPNVFSLLGEVWFVKFKDEEFGLYPNQEKYRYIARMLSLSGENLKCRDCEFSIYNDYLYAKVTGKATEPDQKLSSEDRRGLSQSDLKDVVAPDDMEGIEKIGYELLDALWAAKKTGNQDRIKKAQSDIEKYRSHISNEFGVQATISRDEKSISFHKFYRGSKESEKLRQVIKNQIGNAIKGFDRMPRFKSHLQHSLRAGSLKTVYTPENPTVWTVST